MLANSATVRVKPEAAKEELARRELARRHLVDFSTYIAPWYKPARHHRLVAEYLEQVERYIRTEGEEGIGRLMIFEPPQNGKSEQVSKLFPAWLLGRLPNSHIILTSYNAELAMKNSRAARGYVMEARYQAVFGELGTPTPLQGEGEERAAVGLSEESRSVAAWELAAPNRGSVRSAGAGGGLTGNPAHLVVIDDPFKNREEAESAANRERINDWYKSSARTRLRKGGAIVIMHTRWHQEDLAGERLKAMAEDELADQWVIVSLPAIWEKPAIAEGKTFEEYQRELLREGVYINEKDPLGRESGEALWPEEYNLEWLAETKASVGDYDWEALYQQTPYSREGNFFEREWFTVVDAPPKLEEVVSRMWFWDKAGSRKGGGDYACGGVLSWTKDELLFVENVARKQCTPGERDELMVSSMEADWKTGRPINRIWHQQDPGSAGLDSAQATNKLLLKKMELTKKKIQVDFETMTGSKEVRAGPWSSALQAGQVRLVRGGWNAAFIEEHVAFPKGRYDDQVDMASWGYGKAAQPVGVLFQ